MEVEVRATKEQIKEFKESILWKDMRSELEKWKAAARDEYSQVVGSVISGRSDIENSDMHLGSIYGREMTIDFVISIPDIFIQILEEKEEDESRRE